ncbi:hypothetical protein DL98DRAFT_524852 [Cadophora sp. DSE1049]|nr:hypothetical protein DL98DRAFT_524852 [Cadophora sp. DSE1049]
MAHPQSTIHLPSLGAPLTNTTRSPQQHLSSAPLPYPIDNPKIQAWLQNHEPHVGGLVFIFVFLLVLSGLWRSRRDMVKWYFEKSREEEMRRWVERERLKRGGSVVVVGILRGGRNWRGSGDGCGDGDGDGKGGGSGKGRGLKRVRFLGVDGVDDEMEAVRLGEERVEVVVDFLEDGRVVGEMF